MPDNNSLEESYDKYIEAPLARQALRHIVNFSKNLEHYEFFPKGHGYIRDYRYTKGDEWHYALAINKNSLTFYFRKPCLTNLTTSIQDLKKIPLETTTNRSGEIKVKIYNQEQAESLIRLIFRQKSEPQEETLEVRKKSKKGSDMNEKLIIPASRVQQGDLVLYATSIKVKDLASNGFYSVETLDPENTNDKGYQRLLNKSRAKKLADYIIKGQDSRDAFLPTSVFLATDKNIEFNKINNTIEIDTSRIGPFSVVDGQHRLEGLKMAAEKDERVLSFEVPVNIAINLPKIAQMCHFLIVNTTQKSVDKSVEQRIVARLSDALDVEDDLPSLPKWILNLVEKGEVEKAIKHVDFLNESADSPWFGKIKMANTESGDTTINQRSFVKAIVKYVLTANNPLTAIVKDFDKEKKIFSNYWKAIASILDDGNSSVLYKYNGVELFCKFSIPFFIKLQDRGNFTESTMESLLRSCFDNVEGDYAGVGHPDWWAQGGKASFLNAGAINIISQEMTKALHKSSAGGAIEI